MENIALEAFCPFPSLSSRLFEWPNAGHEPRRSRRRLRALVRLGSHSATMPGGGRLQPASGRRGVKFRAAQLLIAALKPLPQARRVAGRIGLIRARHIAEVGEEAVPRIPQIELDSPWL